jgi:hypothetical protein
MATPAAKLTVSVRAEVRASNGAEVSIDEREVIIRKPGPQGGAGVSVSLPVGDWDAINGAVANVRQALARATELKRELER